MNCATRIVLSGLVAFAMSGVAALAGDLSIIKGKVIFKGDADKFKRTTLDTSKDPNCAKSKAKVGSWEVVINKKTDPMTLANVLVHIKGGLDPNTVFPVPAEQVKLTQVGCEYTPHTVALMEGQTLVVLNGDDTNHNIHLLPKANEEVNFSQPKKDLEKGKELKLKAESPFHVKCDVHPWMGANLAVLKHPFHSVTGEEGTYEIKGMPPGKYDIEAWHEKFGTVIASVEIKSGETKELDLVFEPK